MTDLWNCWPGGVCLSPMENSLIGLAIGGVPMLILFVIAGVFR
jgi:hypothetical protein